jgi:hypothetical protein
MSLFNETVIDVKWQMCGTQREPDALHPIPIVRSGNEKKRPTSPQRSIIDHRFAPRMSCRRRS